MTDNGAKLLRDLTLLLRRYRREDFEELAALIGTRSFTTALARLLDEMAVSARRWHLVKRGAARQADLLENIRIADEPKYAVLRSAKERILDTRLHPKLGDLVRVIQQSGVPLSKQSFRRRDDLVREFLQVARRMPTEELAQVLTKLGVGRTPSDLRSWSDLIVPKDEAS